MRVVNSDSTSNRKSERRPIRLALVLLMDSVEGEIRSDGFTVDVSPQGCRLEVDTPISEGQLVRLLPWESADGAVAGRVVWVGGPESKLAGQAGIELLKPLPFMA